jgi:hypothetical protein
MRAVPAIQVLVLQCAAFLLVLMLAVCNRLLAGMPITFEIAALFQGVLTAALSYWRCLAPWWLLIQLLFPAALLAMLSLDLPPALFLAAFVFLLSIYWTTFRTQVPFYPSGTAVWNAVADLLPQHQAIRFVDIGSGLGGLVLHLARRRPESVFVGIEVAPLPWLTSFLRVRSRRGRSSFIRGNYFRQDLSGYDVVFAYLSPAAMPALMEKAKAEMRCGSLLLSYEFPLPGMEPDYVILPVSDGPALYGWRM